ncbi:MAG: hypothetical protein R3C56_30170 [Pirellulaceae bacterium]
MANPAAGLDNMIRRPAVGSHAFSEYRCARRRLIPVWSGGIPIVGDWDGDGIDTIGVYDPNTQMFNLRNTNSGGRAARHFSIRLWIAW